MKLLYLECNMGAAGDMLMGALADLLPDREAFALRLNKIGIPGARVEFQDALKCGIKGTHAKVSVLGKEEESVDVSISVKTRQPHDAKQGHSHDGSEHQHSHGHHHHAQETSDAACGQHEHTHAHTHHGMTAILEQIDHLKITEQVKEDVKGIYRILAKAEAAVHGRPISEIHFHEVGTLDALMDITGCALLIRELDIDRVVTSPVNVGYGQVRCAHGILPVPAPATARILEGVPCYAGRVEGELCTPTGAAVLKYFSDEYGRLPQMVIRKTGYGMGNKDFPAANCVRAMLGENGTIL